MTLGKLALWPTQLGWIYEDMSSEALKRNSQLRALMVIT